MRGALIVGIDDYHFNPLNGCVNDAKNMKRILRYHENGDINFDVDLVTSDHQTITRSYLKEKIENLFKREQEIALFYFSGHGTENNLGGYIVTPDATRYDEGISVSDILQLANQSKTRERIIILDSCHSGHMGNLPGINNTAYISEGITILTATKSDQKAIQRGGSSIFTSLLLDALEGSSADILGKITIASIYSYIDKVLGFFDQRPLYKSHVTKLVSIRDCLPSVKPEILRKLPDYFPEKDSLYQLDPSYETTSTSFNPEHGKIMLQFQLCRAAGLLEPIHPTVHLYYAAMQRESCRLTRLGKYYWYLANKEKI